jgi:hypothetical protein
MTSPLAQSIFGDLTPNFHANVINAFQASSALAPGLGTLDGEIGIAAHSLGNMLVR